MRRAYEADVELARLRAGCRRTAPCRAAARIILDALHRIAASEADFACRAVTGDLLVGETRVAILPPNDGIVAHAARRSGCDLRVLDRGARHAVRQHRLTLGEDPCGARSGSARCRAGRRSRESPRPSSRIRTRARSDRAGPRGRERRKRPALRLERYSAPPASRASFASRARSSPPATSNEN
jgi:hypothetical protein